MEKNNEDLSQKKAMFESVSPNKKWETSQETNDISKSIAALVSSVRILEDRYINLRKKSQITDQNLIETQKEFFKEKKHINQELVEAKIKLQELKEDISIMKGEFKDVVKQKDIKIINTYLDLWEPTKFATRKEVEELIQKKKD